MITTKEFYGGATAFSFGSSTTMDLRARFWRCTATAAGPLQLSFPPNTTLAMPVGCPVFFIANVGVNTFNVRDSESFGPAVAVAANRIATVSTVLLNGVLRYVLDVRLYGGG